MHNRMLRRVECPGVAVLAPHRSYNPQWPDNSGMFETWWWHYPARKVGILHIFFGISASAQLWVYNAFGLAGWQPGYVIAVGLVGVGTGCALLTCHAQKGGEEDTAAKKKIILVGMAVVMLAGALMMLDVLRII